MTNKLPGEKWKQVNYGGDYDNPLNLQISNFGRMRTFHKLSNGNIIKGALTNGYPTLRMKLFKKREEKVTKKLDNLDRQIKSLTKKIKKQEEKKEGKRIIKATRELLNSTKEKRSTLNQADRLARTVYFNVLVHRMVVKMFLKPPKRDQVIVAHLDYNKENNRLDNLKWMTKEESYAHIAKDPKMIDMIIERRNNPKVRNRTAKLTINQVLQIKKYLQQGKPVKMMVEKYKVTEMQIYRIKWGENWGDVQAPE